MTDFDAAPDDDLFIDFTDVQSKTFDPIPAGWYLFEVKGYDSTATKRDGKTMKAGTKGVNVDFIVSSDDPVNTKYIGRHVFQNFWLTQEQMGFLKAAMEKMSCYAPGELDGPLTRGQVDQMIGEQVWGRATVRAGTGGYSDSNQIQSWRSLDDPPKLAEGEGGGGALSMLP